MLVLHTRPLSERTENVDDKLDRVWSLQRVEVDAHPLCCLDELVDQSPRGVSRRLETRCRSEAGEPHLRLRVDAQAAAHVDGPLYLHLERSQRDAENVGDHADRSVLAGR